MSGACSTSSRWAASPATCSSPRCSTWAWTRVRWRTGLRTLGLAGWGFEVTPRGPPEPSRACTWTWPSPPRCRTSTAGSPRSSAASTRSALPPRAKAQARAVFEVIGARGGEDPRRPAGGGPLPRGGRGGQHRRRLRRGAGARAAGSAGGGLALRLRWAAGWWRRCTGACRCRRRPRWRSSATSRCASRGRASSPPPPVPPCSAPSPGPGRRRRCGS